MRFGNTGKLKIIVTVSFLLYWKYVDIGNWEKYQEEAPFSKKDKNMCWNKIEL